MGFFNFLTKEKSSSVAKDRLKLVLIHDRAMLSPKMLETLKDEIIAVISKYVEIDKDALNIEVSQEADSGRETALVANIPIKIKK
ncbi:MULTISPECIES: cell division topological specificity factor MinE [Cetobacterium]|jgi:cell division topological specificity factor|uniref:Cell division topological specificity factor n=1 Tax=Candidatus Cetobacterium colombiensis TaxID=3073100 RepID=A0ABU4W5Z9_9FUSO|nr:cell division topological specificity factor MinE [Candidatus Cetobacterium colombiensis]MDX8334946.1 cell division topological specificity factor MinE [Candidatus Cetobacterium colombiensis]